MVFTSSPTVVSKSGPGTDKHTHTCKDELLYLRKNTKNQIQFHVIFINRSLKHCHLEFKLGGLHPAHRANITRDGFKINQH